MVDNLAADKYSVPVESIFQIHESPCKIVLAITGGGAEIIGELLRHGSGSATVLDAVVPYSMGAMDNFLGRKPEMYCSEKTARLMAMVAYQRALDLSKGEESAAHDVVGIGATCKLKATNEREGRKHEVHVAIQAACKTGVITLKLNADRTREGEEKIATFLIFNVLARHCGIPEVDLPDRIGTEEERKEEITEKYESVSGPVGDLLKQKIYSQESPYETLGIARIDLNGAQKKEAKTHGENRETEELQNIRLVFPGSFGPCHRNHVFMAKLASEKLGVPVHFEISLTNVDKPPIDFISLNQRLDSLRKYGNETFVGGVCLTNAPLFLQKADLFPNSTFIIGADTFNRLFDAKYYGGKVDISAILRHFREKNIRFLVFQRKSVHMSVNPEILEFCEIVPMGEYEDDGISSTEIRRKQEENKEN
ncbi:hypothetical protein MSSAC_1564 [Methanosarcina siciliae C2J]|uniref:Cytidyltransferase-like domain-containing protein n=1 Tax=Methanosarcina siciliae C2J TaxID=1434118 RepID=A0A0E3PMP1_9EURY|nr:hypothetical protein [Methanosarcina siciliae]AKB36154.1 hypothetical protein MSSAC_1564 [Methanosarcina siciliae C2J]